MLSRRNLFHLALAGAVPLPGAWAETRRVGRLVIIGGAEDRLHEKTVLRTFVAQCGGPQARIRLLSAASSDPQWSWNTYQRAFSDLGVQDFAALDIASREDADDPAKVAAILDADGVFMSGGDQSRLMAALWETRAYRALHTAFHVRGCCIGGTSAGAAVMSRHMLAQAPAVRLPEKDIADMDLGLGLVSSAIVDQHFSERGRLGRLLSVLALHPRQLGLGIDEDTALVIERNQSISVVGQGAVTLVDPRRGQSNVDEIDEGQRLEMLGIQLHLLPAGTVFRADALARGSRRLPSGLREALELLMAPGPIRG